MTGNNDKLRSLFLTALMVMSVFAMTVAFSGSAAAAANIGIDKAVEYNDQNDATDSIEIMFNASANSAVTSGDVTVWVDGNTQSISGIGADDGTGSDGRLQINLNNDIDPNRNLTVKVAGVSANGVDTTDVIAQDITVTSRTLDARSGGTANNVNVYQGEVVAIHAGGGNDVTVEEDDGGIVADDSLMSGSEVYNYDTDGLDTGTKYWANSSASSAPFNINDLGLEITGHSSDVYTDEGITADVAVNRGGQDATGELLDSDDAVQSTVVEQLSANSDTEFDFGSVGDTGEYTISIVDNSTGVEVTETVNVTSPPDEDVVFTDNVVQDESGDIASFEVDLEGTDEATVVYNPETTSRSDLYDAIERAGYISTFQN
jgi:surface glycoprotein (TIGR04207 family)